MTLGQVRLVMGDAAASIPLLKAGLAPGAPPQLALLLALACFECGAIDEAFARATAALEENEEFARAWALRAECRYQRGDLDGALDDIRRAVLIDGPDRWRLRLGSWLLEKALKSGEPDRRALLNEARGRLLERVPEKGESEWRYVVGCVLLELGESQRARAHLSRTFFPSKAEVALRLALAELRHGNRQAVPGLLEEAARDPYLEHDVERLRTGMAQGSGPGVADAVLETPPWRALRPLDRQSLMPSPGHFRVQPPAAGAAPAAAPAPAPDEPGGAGGGWSALLEDAAGDAEAEPDR